MSAARDTAPDPVAGGARPRVVSLCSNFLPDGMLHVYWQVSGLQAFENWVVARHRFNAERFPYARVAMLRQSPVRALRRWWHRRAGRRQAPMSRGEARWLLRFAAARDAALVHIYFGTEAARDLAYLRRETRPKTVSFHGVDVSDELSAADFAALLETVDVFLARSESLRAALIARGCPPERVLLNTTGVDVPAALPPRAPPGPGRPLRLVQACRLIEKKGLDVTLGAVRALRDRGVAVELALYGKGPLEATLRDQARALGIEGAVRLHGFVDHADLMARLAEADVFVQPSRETASGDREGIPNAMLEAMARGVPVVATRHSGIPEVIGDGVNGLLIDAAEAGPLADAVARLRDDPGLYAALSGAARATVERDFSIARSVARLEENYRAVIACATHRRHSALRTPHSAFPPRRRLP